jgi:hypothetical protein
MKRIQISLLLCVVVFATGCPKYSPKVDFNNPNSLVAKINAHIAAQNNLYMAALGNHPEQARQIRNELIENSLPYIDGAYVDFITDIQAGRDRNNFMLDLIELGTAASIGITNGERPLQIIGVALTAFRGGRKSLDANFYKDQSTPILISKMDGNRAKVRATILEREKKDVADYPLGAAVSDLVDYYNGGTLVRAFTQLQQDTAVITKQAEENVLVLKGVPFSPVATPEEVQITADAQVTLGNLQTALANPAQQANATQKLQAIVTEMGKDKDASVALLGAGLTPQSSGTTILTGLVRIRRDLRLANPPNIELLNKINGIISKFGQ